MNANLKKQWPWLAAAPVLLLGADNLLGPALSGQAVQKAFSMAVEATMGPRFDSLEARLDRINRRIDRCRERREE